MIKKCKCHSNSPFLWVNDPRPSIFAKDNAFKPKTPQRYAHLTAEENILVYQQYSVHSRAHPSVKPQLNKHEIS
jgi:hypothetical protein